MTPAEHAKVVLLDHQQHHAGCYCGREEPYTSHAEHLIDELQAAGIELSFAVDPGVIREAYYVRRR